jgi:hypothetical protein
MNRNVAPFALIAALTLSSCAAQPAPSDTTQAPEATAAESPSPTPTPTPTPTSEFGEAVKNDHGNLVKEVGQLAGTTLPEDREVVTSRFTVTGFEIDPECTSGYTEDPVNGHYLKINLHIETTPELARDEGLFLTFNEYAWNAYNEDGTRLNNPQGNAYTCLDPGQQLPAQIGPGETIDGSVVLDVKDTHGSVALTMGGTNGWEWTY